MVYTVCTCHFFRQVGVGNFRTFTIYGGLPAVDKASEWHLSHICFFLPVSYPKLMPHPLLNFSQSDYLIQIVDINSHT